jgi:hypothetical protein
MGSTRSGAADEQAQDSRGYGLGGGGVRGRSDRRRGEGRQVSNCGGPAGAPASGCSAAAARCRAVRGRSGMLPCCSCAVRSASRPAETRGVPECAPARRSISSSTSAPAAAFCSQAGCQMLAKGQQSMQRRLLTSVSTVPNCSCAVPERGRAERATQDTTAAASVECCPHGRGTARAARRRHRTSRRRDSAPAQRLHACHSAGAKQAAPHPALAARAAPQQRENAPCSPLTSANACLRARDGSGTPAAQAAAPPAQPLRRRDALTPAPPAAPRSLRAILRLP